MGLGLFDTFVEQGLAKIDQILIHGGFTSITGSLLQQLYEHHQLELGSATPFLFLPYDKLHQLTTHTWWIEIWEFVQSYRIHLHNDELLLPPLQRIGDKSLMDLLMKYDNIPFRDI